MRILIVIVATDPALCRIVEERQGRLIPESFRKKDNSLFEGASFQLLPVSAESGINAEQLLDQIEDRIQEDTVGIVMLCDRNLGLSVPSLSDIYFMTEFDQNRPTPSPQNFISAQLNKTLRDFGYLLSRFKDAKYQKVLRLPIRNFAAPEIARLRAVCTRSTDEAGFARRIDDVLKQFRQRQHPKRKSGSYEKEYLVDDDGKYFELGKEEHARAETGPPHIRLCRLAKHHRFGCGFSPNFHYNVSRDGRGMTGEYKNCHDEDQPGKGATHLNMFTSDFF